MDINLLSAVINILVGIVFIAISITLVDVIYGIKCYNMTSGLTRLPGKDVGRVSAWTLSERKK